MALRGYRGMVVTPVSEFAPVGNSGGPFDPNSQTYTITNTSDETIEYEAVKSQDWISLDGTDGPLTGTIEPNEAIDITASLNINADYLPAGSYSDSIEFTNITTGIGTASRVVKFQPEIIYNGTTIIPYARCLAIDYLGNLFVTGQDYSNGDRKISKTDPDGIQIWEYSFQGSVNPQDILCDWQGNIYIAGNFSGTVDLDPTQGEDWYESSSGPSFVTRINRDGTYGWSQMINFNYTYSLACDPFGRIIISGGDYYTKLNSDGSFVWTYSVPDAVLVQPELDKSLLQ